MDQLIVTLKPGTDIKFMRKVLKTINSIDKVDIKPKDIKHANKKNIERKLRIINELHNSINPSIIDLDDERTRYIMSK